MSFLCCQGKRRSRQNIPVITQPISVINEEEPVQIKSDRLPHNFKDGITSQSVENTYTPSPISNAPLSNSSTFTSQNRKYIAQHDFTTRDKDCVSFKKGDHLVLLDNEVDDWIKVRHLSTKKIGFIPKNFVAAEDTLESRQWYFGNITRMETKNLLMNESSPDGTFLIRLSDKDDQTYSLSIKDIDDQKNKYVIRHYKISTENSTHIIGRNCYNSLDELVHQNSINRLLCCKLTQSCQKPLPLIWDLGPTNRDIWEIPRHEITLGKLLGSGNFGQVYLGKWKDGIEVAVKTLKPGTATNASFLKEASVMKQIRHKNLVALYGVCTEDASKAYIVQEYIKHGALLELLKKNKKTKANEQTKIDFVDLLYIAFQIASGMAYLELNQFVHRDLAARNVLIGENNVAKVCDFGLTRPLSDDVYVTANPNIPIPIKWTAPECFKTYVFTTKSDVWSYGVLLMEIFTYGETPYAEIERATVKKFVISGGRMRKPNGFNENVYRKALECWNEDPKRRPTFEHLQHYFEFFNQDSEQKYAPGTYGNLH